MKKIFCVFFTVVALIALSLIGATSASAAEKEGITAAEEFTSYGLLFESDGRVDISEGRTSSAYTNVSPKEGVVFTSGDEGATVRFKNKLDISSNKRTDVLAEILVMPSIQDTADFYELIITLEDAYDPENKITISFYRGMYDSMIGMIKAKAPGQVLAGYNANTKKMHAETERGTPVYASFNGVGVKGLSGTLRLGFDYSARALYAYPEVYSQLNDSNLVNKFADPKYVSEEWGGFTTGEVYMSFTFSSIKRTQAEFMLLNINGQSLAGKEISDEKDPVISVDTEGNEEVPAGIVDYPYPLFPVTVFDEIDGEMSGAQIAVYKGTKEEGDVYASGFSGELTSFIPDSEGKYTFTYTAEDLAGRRTEKVFETEIRKPWGDLYYRPDGEFPDSAKVGEKIELPGGTAENGSGKVTVVTSVKRIGDETEIALSDGAFTPKEQGVYNVTVRCTDYLRREYTLSRKIVVKESDTPVIEEPFVPRYVVSGKPVIFEDFKAYDYFSTPGYPRETNRKSIRIYNEEGVLLAEPDYADRSYVPDISFGNKIIVEYRAACVYDAEKISVFRKTVEVLEIEEVGNYFYDESGNTSMLPGETSVVYKTETDGAGRVFVNALPAEGFSFTFTVPLEYNRFDSVAVWLEDAADPRIKVKLSVCKNASDSNSIYSKLYVNDKGEAADILGSFYETTNNFFIIGLQGRSITDASSGVIMSVSETVYGQRFEGFPSGKIYLSFTMEGVEGESAVEVNRVINQMISDIDDDYIRPVIIVSEEVKRDRHYGEEVKIPAAKAMDVLDQKVVLTVSVTDKRGNYLVKDSAILSDLYFTARSYGVYKIEYKAVDSRGNISTQTYSVEILDEVKPEMTIEGNLPSTVKRGEKVKLPSAIVTDNVSVNLRADIFVIEESGKMNVVDGDEYVFSQKGKYIVRYFCRDDEYNFVIRDFVITVE